MRFLTCALLVIASVSAVFSKSDIHPLSDEFIEEINRAQSSWKAGRNFGINTTMEFLDSLTGLIDIPDKESLPRKEFQLSGLHNLPQRFDARERWPQCKSLRHIRDQSYCGSCWAVAAASAMTDRLCIKSNGAKTVSVSAADIMSCAVPGENGCEGNNIYEPWRYWSTEGAVTGGDYGSNDGCKNYPFPSCPSVPWSKKPPCYNKFSAPACRKICDSRRVNYYNERTFGSSVYFVRGEEEMMREIMENGPIEGAMTVYEDFPQYKSGVYHYVRGEKKNGHAVKILGWGVENGEKYWLVANSWNSEWGDHGFFKIRRGTNETGIEDYAIAGTPRLY